MARTQHETLSTIDRKIEAFEQKAARNAKDRIGTTHHRVSRYQQINRGKRELRRTGINGRRWRYIDACQGCGADIREQYAALGMSNCPIEPRENLTFYFPTRTVDEQVVPCHACGADPRIRRIRGAPPGKKLFRPTWSRAFPESDPGYVPGRGVYIDDMSTARSYAKRYGMTLVEGEDG